MKVLIAGAVLMMGAGVAVGQVDSLSTGYFAMSGDSVARVWVDTSNAVLDVLNSSGVAWVTVNAFVQDCEGDDLMFNYRTAQIEEIDVSNFGDREASLYLIQAPGALEAYQWMRRNRKQYSLVEMVVRVNRWFRG